MVVSLSISAMQRNCIACDCRFTLILTPRTSMRVCVNRRRPSFHRPNHRMRRLVVTHTHTQSCDTPPQLPQPIASSRIYTAVCSLTTIGDVNHNSLVIASLTHPYARGLCCPMHMRCCVHCPSVTLRCLAHPCAHSAGTGGGRSLAPGAAFISMCGHLSS